VTEGDLAFVEELLLDGVLKGPVLELGAGYGGNTCRRAIGNAGLAYYATDVAPSEGVDFVANFEAPSVTDAFDPAVKFETVLVLNVLEHTFDPIRVMDNARSLLVNGGNLVIITPTVWTLHEYPIDCYRLLPQWYEVYAVRQRMTLLSQYFRYIGLDNVDAYKDRNGNYQFPSPCNSLTKYWWSRVVHRIFNTFGRGMAFPSHLAIGAVMQA
jgi:SAM-dependent methyltransferase